MAKKNQIIVMFSCILSLLSLIIAIVALCRCCPRSLQFDYLGVIVGILALLVTILIGWNIYSTVDFRRKIEEVESIKKNTFVESNMNLASAQSAVSGYYRVKLLGGEIDYNYMLYKYLYHRMFSVYHASVIAEKEVIANSVSDMIMVINLSSKNELSESFNLKESEQKELFDIWHLIKRDETYNHLIDKLYFSISKIPTIADK